MNSFTGQELHDLCALVPRIFSDYRESTRGPFEMAYIFTNTPDNDDSTFIKAIELAQTEMIKELVVCGGAARNGYAGLEHSMERLRALGLDEHLMPVTILEVQDTLNTRTEAEAFAEYMHVRTGDTAIIAAPFHIVRAFTTLVSVLKEPTRRVYAVPGAPLSWNEVVRHSQGTLKGTRASFIETELERMKKYQAQEFGGLYTPRQMLAYLDSRDDYTSRGGMGMR